MSVLDEIRRLVAEIAEVDEAEIRGDAHFIQDLGIDSLAALEVLAVLEKRYGIRVPEEAIPTMTTLNNMVAGLRPWIPAAA